MHDQSDDSRPKLVQLFVSYFDFVLLGVTALVAGLVNILDWVGVLDEAPWLADRVPTLTLLLIGLVAAYLVIERRSQLESMQRSTEQRIDGMTQALTKSTATVIESLQGVHLEPFEDGNELIRYVNKRLLQARRQIDDLSWSPAVGLARELKVTREASEEHEERVLRIAQRIPYREVFIFNRPGRVEKLKRRTDANLPGYSCAYYETPKVPLIQFMIIDKEEVILLSDQFETKFTVRQPHIVQLFIEYYDQIWNNATPLKVGTTINEEEIQKLLGEAASLGNGT